MGGKFKSTKEAIEMEIATMKTSVIRFYLLIEEEKIVAAKKNKWALLYRLVQTAVATDSEKAEYAVLQAEAVEKQKLEKLKERMAFVSQLYMNGDATDEEKEELEKLENLLLNK